MRESSVIQKDGRYYMENPCRVNPNTGHRNDCMFWVKNKCYFELALFEFCGRSDVKTCEKKRFTSEKVF
jgi:hypothetical protein